MVANANELELQRAADWTAFQDFKRQWLENTLTDAHPVVVKTRKWARRITQKYNCTDRAEDLSQNGLIRLVWSSYRGEASLDTYIKLILEHDNTAEWRKNGGNLRSEFPSEMTDDASQELFEKVLKRISSDRLLEELLTTRPELQRTIIETIVRAETNIGSRKLAEIGSELLERPITRHQVEAALKQLREYLERPSGYHKATAGK